MKKIILIIVLFIGFNSYSQINDQKYDYCEITGSQKYTSKRMNITIDYGKGGKVIKQEKVAEFNPLVVILNSMSEEGWVISHAYPVTTGNNITVYHWILKKKKL